MKRWVYSSAVQLSHTFCVFAITAAGEEEKAAFGLLLPSSRTVEWAQRWGTAGEKLNGGTSRRRRRPCGSTRKMEWVQEDPMDCNSPRFSWATSCSSLLPISHSSFSDSPLPPDPSVRMYREVARRYILRQKKWSRGNDLLFHRWPDLSTFEALSQDAAPEYIGWRVQISETLSVM